MLWISVGSRRADSHTIVSEVVSKSAMSCMIFWASLNTQPSGQVSITNTDGFIDLSSGIQDGSCDIGTLVDT